MLEKIRETSPYKLNKKQPDRHARLASKKPSISHRDVEDEMHLDKPMEMSDMVGINVLQTIHNR